MSKYSSIISIKAKYQLAIFIVLFLLAFSTHAQTKSINIVCNETDFQNIYTNYKENIYIPVTIKYESHQWNAEMRIRGDASRVLPKKSFKIKFTNDTFVTGKTTLILNSEYNDKSYLRTFLSTYLFNQSNYYCSEAQHIKVFLNSNFFGLYLMMNNIDNEFLIANNLNINANLYESKNRGASLNVYDNIHYHWKKENNKSTDWKDIEKLIDNLNDCPVSEYYQFAKATFDYEKMINIIAINMLIANGSTYYHNYYIYNNSEKWLMIPWDFDKTFSAYGIEYPYHSSSNYWTSVLHDNPFFEKAILCEAIFNDVKTKLTQIHNNIFNPLHLNPIIDSIKNSISEAVESDSIDNISDTNEWKNAITQEVDFIKNRYDELIFQFNNFPSAFNVIAKPHINNDEVTFSWNKSKSPKGKVISYKLYYSLNDNFFSAETKIVSNINDTFYKLSLPEGQYFWKVVATDGIFEINGFDVLNTFIINNNVENIVINEINYNSSSNFDTDDWVEFYNPDNVAINLSGYVFKDNSHSYKFREGCIIGAKDYLVLCENAEDFTDYISEIDNYIGNTNFGFSSNGEVLTLFDSSGKIVDVVEYSPSYPWASEADGKGPTLELIQPYFDNFLAKNWRASSFHGTAGKLNGVYGSLEISITTDIKIYPNPANNLLNIIAPKETNIESITIYNSLGKVTFHKNKIQSKNPVKIELNKLESGIYILKLCTVKNTHLKRFIVVK
ncbi:MAG: CotH kinase family protein [Bacteroidota bacterium]|nr:CotH kinase family protein [Bacteroidota bacterium]